MAMSISSWRYEVRVQAGDNREPPERVTVRAPSCMGWAGTSRWRCRRAVSIVIGGNAECTCTGAGRLLRLSWEEEVVFSFDCFYFF